MKKSLLVLSLSLLSLTTLFAQDNADSSKTEGVKFNYLYLRGYSLCPVSEHEDIQH